MPLKSILLKALVPLILLIAHSVDDYEVAVAKKLIISIFKVMY